MTTYTGALWMLLESTLNRSHKAIEHLEKRLNKDNSDFKEIFQGKKIKLRDYGISLEAWNKYKLDSIIPANLNSETYNEGRPLVVLHFNGKNLLIDGNNRYNTYKKEMLTHALCVLVLDQK